MILHDRLFATFLTWWLVCSFILVIYFAVMLHRQMKLMSPAPLVTLPHQIVPSLPTGLYLMSGVPEYFGVTTKDGKGAMVCIINSSQDSRRASFKDGTLISEPDVTFCKEPGFWRQLRWAWRAIT